MGYAYAADAGISTTRRGRENEMGELGIILAIVLCAWVYASLHPVNEVSRSSWETWVVANVLFVGAIAAGIASAVGL